MKKILLLIDSLGPGGAQRQLVYLAKGFKSKGHNVSFVVYHKDDFYYSELKAAGIDINQVIEPNYIKRIIKIRKFIRKGNVDAVISFLEAAGFIATLSGFPHRKWKLIVGERSANPDILKSFKLRFYRWFHLFADYIVANSQANIDMVKKINPLLPKRKLKVIYNAIEINTDNLNISNNLQDDFFRIVVGARHQYLKNSDGLIEAVNLLPDSTKEKIRIDWYGEKSVDDSFTHAQQKITSYNLQHIFTFYNPTSDIYNKIAEADAIGLFSHYEGLPNFICEGMVIGKLVICTKVSDLPLLLKDRINVFFCNSTDTKSIAKALQDAIGADKITVSNMIERNKEIAKALFSGEHIIESYLELL